MVEGETAVYQKPDSENMNGAFGEGFVVSKTKHRCQCHLVYFASFLRLLDFTQLNGKFYQMRNY